MSAIAKSAGSQVVPMRSVPDVAIDRVETAAEASARMVAEREAEMQIRRAALADTRQASRAKADEEVAKWRANGSPTHIIESGKPRQLQAGRKALPSRIIDAEAEK